MQTKLFPENRPVNKYPNKINYAPDSPDKTIEKKKASPINYIIDVQKFRTLQDLMRLKVSILDAENVKNFNRYLLHLIYRDIINDPNLDAQWNSRKMKTKEKPFKIVEKDGITENKECTGIFENSSWFIDFIDGVLDSKQWGFTLMEFGSMTMEGEFLPYQINGKIYPPVNIIDRDNVKPELGIITDTPGNSYGISMNDPKYSDNIMFVGEYRKESANRFGWLFKAAKYILFKDNCLGNWSEWAEIYGMPMRIGYTHTEGEQRERFIRAIRDLGSNSYGVFTPQDKVEFIDQARHDGFHVYENMIKYIDEQISKLIFGQDVVTNNTGRVVGEVGENVSNMYGTTDAKFVQAIINNRLIPMMINLGCKKLVGKKFIWDNTEKLTLEQRIKIDQAISSMGYKPKQKYLETTYGVELEEMAMGKKTEKDEQV